MRTLRQSRQVQALLDQHDGRIKHPNVTEMVTRRLSRDTPPTSAQVQRTIRLLTDMEADGHLTLVWRSSQLISGIFNRQLADQWAEVSGSDSILTPRRHQAIAVLLAHQHWTIPSFIALSKALGIGPGAAAYHLEALKKGEVISRRHGSQRCTLKEGPWLWQFGTAAMASH